MKPFLDYKKQFHDYDLFIWDSSASHNYDKVCENYDDDNHFKTWISTEAHLHSPKEKQLWLMSLIIITNEKTIS